MTEQLEVINTNLENDDVKLNSDLDHIDMILTGYETYLSNISLKELSGCEKYYLNVGMCYGISGSEGGFWDKVKETASKTYEMLKNIIKNIISYFTGDGQRAIDDSKNELGDVIKALKELNTNIPIPEGSKLLKAERYFKPPSVEGLDEESIKTVNTEINKIDSIVKAVVSSDRVGPLVTQLEVLGNASVSSAQVITDLIKKISKEADTSIEKMKTPGIPKEGEVKEVQDSKKQETQEDIKQAKTKTNNTKKLASIRNKFLAPSKVVIGLRNEVEKLKNDKSFKE